MGTYLQTCITIGGVIKKSDVEHLLEAIRDEGVSLDWGEPFWEPHTLENLLAAIDEDSGHLILYTDARGGQCETLEAALHELVIEHDIESDGDGFEFTGERRAWRRELLGRPGSEDGYLHQQIACIGSSPLVEGHFVAEAIALLKTHDSAGALAKLSEGLPSIPDLPRIVIKE